MKLTENNAKFAVVATAFHHGGTISFHTSLEAAKKARKKYAGNNCECGCAGVVPITKEAKKEIVDSGFYDSEEVTLYSDLPTYQANGESPYTICK